MAASQISIRPGIGMLGLFPHMKYQPWYALGELVDNAIQSDASNRGFLRANDPGHRLVVDIEITKLDGGSITVRDNAAGIKKADWARAFRVAEPPSDASGLSQFGIGMKAACCWFAREWSVRTSTLGSPAMRTVSFDVPRIVEQRDETLEVDESAADPQSHGTVIEMRNLYRPVQARTLGKIRDYLGGIYRQFLRDGDLVLTVNGELVRFQEPGVLEAPRYNDPAGEVHRWRKSIDLHLSSGRRVRGFVAIRSIGDSKSAGLALMYRRKVVTGSGEEFYKPPEIYKSGNSFESQRVFGELMMDDFDVTYTKDALVWYDEEEEFIELLRAELDGEPWPLIRQAREYRKRSPEQAAGAAVAQSLDNIVNSLVDTEQELFVVDSEDTSSETALDSRYQTQVLPGMDISGPPPPEPIGRTVEIDFHGTSWNIELRLVADDAVSRWLTVKKRGDRELALTVNQSHPFMRAWCELPGQDLEPVWRVAIALGLAQELARLGGAKMPGMVTENVNRLLRDVMSRKA